MGNGASQTQKSMENLNKEPDKLHSHTLLASLIYVKGGKNIQVGEEQSPFQ